MGFERPHLHHGNAQFGADWTPGVSQSGGEF
jgi:hypothetical protein